MRASVDAIEANAFDAHCKPVALLAAKNQARKLSARALNLHKCMWRMFTCARCGASPDSALTRAGSRRAARHVQSKKNDLKQSCKCN
jgi:hypothetical protein